jgi:hypothetical protein
MRGPPFPSYVYSLPALGTLARSRASATRTASRMALASSPSSARTSAKKASTRSSIGFPRHFALRVRNGRSITKSRVDFKKLGCEHATGNDTVRPSRSGGALSSNRQLIAKPPLAALKPASPALCSKGSVGELFDRCRVSQSAISQCEKVDDTPKIHARNLNASRLVLEEHGIEFLDLNGVRLPRPAMEAGRE